MTHERTSNAPAIVVSTLLGLAGVLHFAKPEFFDAIVPSWMPGSARTTTYASGVAELASAGLIANPSTRRVGGLVAMATFIGVFPANIWAALQGGMKGMDPPFDSAAVAWGRLPLQFPMIWAAWRVYKNAQHTSHEDSAS